MSEKEPLHRDNYDEQGYQLAFCDRKSRTICLFNRHFATIYSHIPTSRPTDQLESSALKK